MLGQTCWGAYDWSHMAMNLWPERVIPKCVDNASYAIAHGLDGVFWLKMNDNGFIGNRAHRWLETDYRKARCGKTRPGIRRDRGNFSFRSQAEGEGQEERRTSMISSNALHEQLCIVLKEKLAKRRVVVWYDARSEFHGFISDLAGNFPNNCAPVEVRISGHRCGLSVLQGSFFEVKFAVESLVHGDLPGPTPHLRPGLATARSYCCTHGARSGW